MLEMAKPIIPGCPKMKEKILTNKGYKGKNVLGDQIEGLVLSFGDRQLKVTTPEVKRSIAAARQVRK